MVDDIERQTLTDRGGGGGKLFPHISMNYSDELGDLLQSCQNYPGISCYYSTVFIPVVYCTQYMKVMGNGSQINS